MLNDDMQSADFLFKCVRITMNICVVLIIKLTMTGYIIIN